jgi:NADP-dependent 3-hydroxy acid dehydrogenase YdfG
MPVAVGARREDRLMELVAEIGAAGGRALPVRVDVTRPDECAAFIERTVGEFGSIYGVFANAGIGHETAIAAMSDADMRAIFEANFFGTLNTIRPALPRMIEARAGHVLTCSSCLSKCGMPFHGAYSATKAAQEHISRALRIELRSRGVRWAMQPPERVARAIVACLRRPRPEVWTSTIARLAFAAADISPRFTDWCLTRFTSRDKTG